MKNREWLSSQNEYDLLLTMQKDLEKAMERAGCDITVCIMDALVAETNEMCRNHSVNCKSCIQSWLNEERR